MRGHLGKPLESLQRSDYRAWLATRQEQGLKASSTARALSVLRSFVKHLTRRGKTRIEMTRQRVGLPNTTRHLGRKGGGPENGNRDHDTHQGNAGSRGRVGRSHF